jgi:hypothetical protein
MRSQQKQAGTDEFAPFQGSDEWDLARWLSKNVSQTATDEYLQLPIVSRNRHTEIIFTYISLFKEQEGQAILPQQSRVPEENR